MDNRNEMIRVRAYEIWEHQGNRGTLEDHWLEAERELTALEKKQGAPQDPFEATVEQASPVEVLDPNIDSSEKNTRPPESSKG